MAKPSPRSPRVSLTVGGLPGTGTSTLCKLLAEATGTPYTYAGRLFRDEAAARGMSLAAFGKLCETDSSVDKNLDAKQLELLQGPPLILEGRLAGWLAHANGVPSVRVWVTCEDGERGRRIAERDGGSIPEALATTKDREASERARYQAYYGVDLAVLEYYDLVLDSSNRPPADLADEVLAAWLAKAKPEA